jgi:AcrR family transcriptional regulator
MAGRKQFDLETALDAAMVQFWRVGYAGTSVDDLSRATGLNRSSIYSSLGDKDTLFLRCIDRYTTRYGLRFDQALATAAESPLTAIRAFFEVTLQRIADPDVPDGCLVAQSVMTIPSLSPKAAQHARQALDLQRTRLRTALSHAGLPDQTVQTLIEHTVAVNQALAVMSRGGAGTSQLEDVIEVTMTGLAALTGCSGAP